MHLHIQRVQYDRVICYGLIDVLFLGLTISLASCTTRLNLLYATVASISCTFRRQNCRSGGSRRRRRNICRHAGPRCNPRPVRCGISSCWFEARRCARSSAGKVGWKRTVCASGAL